MPGKMVGGYTGLHDKSCGRFGEFTEADDKESVKSNVSLLKEMKTDILRAIEECDRRCLINSAKWLSELGICLQDVPINNKSSSLSLEEEVGSYLTKYNLAKYSILTKEYERSAFYTDGCTDRQLTSFIHLYSRYLSGEKSNAEDCTQPILYSEQHNSVHLRELNEELSVVCNQDNFNKIEHKVVDGYHIWLYGVVLKGLELRPQAVEAFCHAIHLKPSHWGAWLELAALVTNQEMLEILDLPDHWMKRLFMAHVYLEIHLNDEALQIYKEFESAGLHNCTYLKAQMALAHDNQKDVDEAITLFKELSRQDPFRLEHVDMYSNLLYVKEMRVELAHLSHRVYGFAKYKAETCCVVGNYYSLRGHHDKAVQYFQRALRLNPQHLGAWILMGHEYVEIKNTNAAIQCYRQAIKVNGRDHRPWYGLGQMYELLKLDAYCLYYYKQAHRLQPNDSRTLIALGDCYDKLEKCAEAKKCYHKAHSIGDVESLALCKLAKLYRRLGERDRAMVVYEKYLQERDDTCELRGEANLYLAESYLQKGLLDLAYEHATKCTLYMETKETAKSLLRDIERRRTNTVINSEEKDGNHRPLRPWPSQDDTSNSLPPPLNLSFSP